MADWADDGSIEYTPDNKPGEIVVTIPEAFKDDSEYDEEAKTVSMSLLKGSSITLSTTSNSPLGLTRIYAGGIAGEKYDWMEISDPVTADIAYTIDPLSPAESEAIDMASTENDEIVIEDIEYPDEGDIFQSDMQDVMDWVAGETMDIPLLDNAIYSDDTIVEDSQLFSI